MYSNSDVIFPFSISIVGTSKFVHSFDHEHMGNVHVLTVTLSQGFERQICFCFFFLLPIFQYWILYSPNIRNKFSRAHMIDKSANKMIRELAYVVLCCEAHGTWKILLLSLVTVLEMGFVSVYTNGYKSHNRTEKFSFITIYCWCIGNTCWNLTCLFNFVVRVAANVFLLRNQQFSISIYICCPFWVSNSLFKSSTL